MRDPDDRPSPYGLPPGSVAVVLGAGHAATAGDVLLRPLRLPRRKKRSSPAEQLARVRALLLDAQFAGATHLVVPQAEAEWLADHPRVAAHLASHHAMSHAVDEDGSAAIVFALDPPEPVAFAAEVSGWTIRGEQPLRLVAERDLSDPACVLRCLEPAVGALRGRLRLRLTGLDSLRVQFAFRVGANRAIHVGLRQPDLVLHDVERAEARLDPRHGTLDIAFDLETAPGDPLRAIRLGPFTDDNWRVHPGFPGGASFALPDAAPAGATLELLDAEVCPVAAAERGPAHPRLLGAAPTRHRKPAGRLRDAVVFSSWVPEEGLELGTYFLDLLARHHADSRIFVGVNHGSTPEWGDRLRASGLDLAVCPAAPTLTLPFDPTGFVAALDAYRREAEPFDLVWFGHNKGGVHLRDRGYPAARWVIERDFWDRRPAVEAMFDRPEIGLWAPHYLAFQPEHLAQTTALEKIRPGLCQPLCVMAVSTHFVLRDTTLRAFCAEADPRFWVEGAAPFGGDRFFFEMAFPNLPITDGYEPFVEDGRGGTIGPPAAGERFSALNDWRQNHAIVRRELDLWRANPTTYRPGRHAHRRMP